MSATFQIFLGNDDQYYFRFLSTVGRNLGYSEGYVYKSSAYTGIDSVKINSQEVSNFEVLKRQDDDYYFRLKAANGEIIMKSSKSYRTIEDANKDINYISLFAKDATTEELAGV